MINKNKRHATVGLIGLLWSGQMLYAQTAIDASSGANGLTDIFSATFDGALTPCGPGSTSYCPFFNGEPGTTRAIVVSPNPTGVATAVPGGIPGAAAGSSLNLTVNGNTLELRGGTIAFDPLSLTILGATSVNPSGLAGLQVAPGLQTAGLNAQGQAEFLVNLVPSVAADFSNFTSIIQGPYLGSGPDCFGPSCLLIPGLSLDMVRYRLFVDFDPTFTAFTASFIGQTSNNSVLFATLNSVVPEIAITDSVAPPTDLRIPFGDVTELTSATQTVTISNPGTGNLLLGTVALADPLSSPFALANDTCTGATVLPAASCTFDVTFVPTAPGSFTDTLDIPSNDLDESTISFSVEGTGVAAAVPNIAVADSVAPASDLQVPFGNVTVNTAQAQAVTVTNTGNADLLVGTVASADPLASPFSISGDGCSGQTVAPAGTCTLNVTFLPTATGAASDAFDIPSNDSSDPTITVNLSGTGLATATPDISVADSTAPSNDLVLAFGNLTEGTSRDGSVTVTNAGSANLVLGSVAVGNPLAAPYSVVSDGCSGQSLAPAALCNIVIRYAPSTVGANADSFDLPSNDPDEASVTVNISGTGIVEGEGGVDTPTPDGADSGFMAMDPATLLLLGAAGAVGLRRRRTGCRAS